MARRPLFVLFGIPVVFDPFFLFGALIIYSLSGGGREGVITVIALAILVLIHELGHALTARAFGATSMITVTFLGGYASYSPSRRLATWQTNVISVAGPAVQLVASVPALIVAQHLAQNGTTSDQRLLGAQIWSA